MLLIKTQRDMLLTPLQSVSGIVEKRHTLPILSNVLLEKKGDKLTLLAVSYTHLDVYKRQVKRHCEDNQKNQASVIHERPIQLKFLGNGVKTTRIPRMAARYAFEA